MWKIGDFAKLAGVSTSTLRRWESESRLVPDRTMGNQRLYTDKHLATVKNLKDTQVVAGSAIIYCRVSSGSQKEDLARQVSAMEQFCLSRRARIIKSKQV